MSEIKPWTIKKIPHDIRDAAIRMAKKADLDIGEYVALAIQEKIKNDRKGSRALVGGKENAIPLDLEQVKDIAETAKMMRDAGCELPKNLQRRMASALNKVLIAGNKGLLKKESKTFLENGHTSEE